MSIKKKSKKEIPLTAAQVKRLIARERKLWETDRAAEKLATQQVIEYAKAKGRVLTQWDRARAHRSFGCTHKKGGTISFAQPSIGLSKGGDSRRYAVIKHQMMHGDIWVRCLRCGKWWKPPIRSEYKRDRDFWRALFEYEEAVLFPTDNTTSGSVQCKFSAINRGGQMIDATEIVREQLANAAGY